MDIKKLLIENDKPVAVVIKDGELEYPVRLESLHHPVILDALLESGWELKSLPYGIAKDGLTIADLPRGMYSDENISRDQEIEMEYMVNGLYSEVDLKALMKSDVIQYLEFRQSSDMIDTRENFLKFLDGLSNVTMELTNPEIILPINAIVSKNALFTLEEYFAPENRVYREKLNKLRTLSLKQFKALYEKFVELGMSKEFTLENFIDFYMSWGIPGLYIPLISKEDRIEKLRLDADDNIRDERFKMYYKKRKLSYLNADKEVYRGEEFGSNWSPIPSAEEISKISKNLSQIGYNNVEPILMETVSPKKVTYLTSSDVMVKYDTNMILIRDKKTGTHEIPLLSIVNENKEKLPERVFQSIIDETNEIFEYSYITAIADEILNRTRVNITATSYSALKTTGASDKSIIQYIFKNEEVILSYLKALKEEESNNAITIGDLTDEVETGTKKQSSVDDMRVQGLIYSGVYADKALSYISNDLPETDPDYKLISDIWNSIKSGELLLDNLQSGKLNDQNMINRNKYVNYITVANRYLGISLDDIMARVSEIDLTELEESDSEINIDFQGNGLALRMPISIINNTERAYYMDIDDYESEQSKKALFIYEVDGVIEELGGTHSKRRHVAAFGKSFRLYDKNKARILKPVMQELTFQYLDIVDDCGFPDSIRTTYAELKNKVVYAWMFQIGKTGKYKIPKQLLVEDQDEIVVASDSIRQAIRNGWSDFCDTTVLLEDAIFDETGDFYSYCTNAIITPYFVLPKRKGEEFYVYPFVPTFVNTYGAAYDQHVKTWAKNRMMPLIFDESGQVQRGFQCNYTQIGIPRNNERDALADEYGLEVYWKDARAYMEQMKINYNLGNPVHPYEKTLPDYISGYYDKEPRQDDSEAPQKWRLESRYLTNKEEFLKTSEIFGSLFKPKRIKALKKPGFYIFKGYTAEDFVYLEGTKDLHLEATLPGEFAIRRINNELEVVFDDGTVCAYTDVENLYETGKYKIVRISGRKFICEAKNGMLLGVNV